MTSDEELYRHAITSLNIGNFTDSERSFKALLKRQPKHVGALNLLTIILMRTERYGEAEDFIRTATRINQGSDVSFYNYGLVLKALGRPREALEKFNLALGLKPDVSETWNNRGTVFNELKEYQNAIVDFDKAIALNHGYAEAYANKGKSLHELKRYDEALAAYDEALAQKPGLSEAWLGRGAALNELKRYDQALLAYDKALTLKPSLAESWLGRGNTLREIKKYDQALNAYDKALAVEPNLENAWLNRGNVLTVLQRYDEAFAAYEKALGLNPDLDGAWLGRGNVFFQLGRFDEAFPAYDKALAINPTLENAWIGRGNVFTALAQHDKALAAFEKALALKTSGAALGGRLNAKLLICDWSNLEADIQRLLSAVRHDVTGLSPFLLLSIPSTLSDQLECAKICITDKRLSSQSSSQPGTRYEHDRIRVAYVSSDFRSHPVSYLLVGLIEGHNRNLFSVTGVSLQPEDSSEFGQRIKLAFDDFIDVSRMSDENVAQVLREREIDIVVDLNGHTKGDRCNIFASRPAPVQVNYLGYPGTMGAEYIDYLIADHTLIPETDRQFYTEKIAYLPDTYQANDSKRAISNKTLNRKECGLPDTGFVFCNFNNNFKILPQVFDCWMRLLKRIDGSVLWLLEDSQIAGHNLRAAAATRGVDPKRLVFAERLHHAGHLARHRFADLFLDTMPYNAHTTASDALWAGLPLLTLIGDTFAGRVAASLLTAVGLPELITTTPQEYEELAIELATNPERLAMVKDKLASNRATAPLFDTRRYTRHIEAAYIAMYERHKANLPPDHIVVPR